MSGDIARLTPDPVASLIIVTVRDIFGNIRSSSSDSVQIGVNGTGLPGNAPPLSQWLRCVAARWLPALSRAHAAAAAAGDRDGPNMSVVPVSNDTSTAGERRFTYRQVAAPRTLTNAHRQRARARSSTRAGQFALIVNINGNISPNISLITIRPAQVQDFSLPASTVRAARRRAIAKDSRPMGGAGRRHGRRALHLQPAGHRHLRQPGHRVPAHLHQRAASWRRPNAAALLPGEVLSLRAGAAGERAPVARMACLLLTAPARRQAPAASTA
jgi:hypothetical protein